MKHNYLTLVLAILMSMVSSFASAYDFKIDGIYYSITSSSDPLTVAVVYPGLNGNGYYDKYTGSVTIPKTVTYKGKTYSVTSIDGAFSGCSDLTSVTIPNSVTSIGYRAFYDCTGLTSITIPNSVTSIGGYAFSGCNGLTTITIPNNVTSIGSSAFGGCSGLTSITIPNSVTSIDDKVFYNCTGLTSVTIPNSVTSIGYSMFAYCSSLTSVTIPESVTSIGASAFYNTRLKSVTIGAGVLSIGNNAFGYSSTDITSHGSKPTKVIWLTNTPPTGYANAAGMVNYVANEQYSLYNKTVYQFLSSMFEVDGVKYVPVSPSERTCDAIDCCYNSTAARIHIGKTVSYKGIDMSVKKLQPYICYQNPNIQEVVLENDGDVPNNAFNGCTGLTKVSISNEGTIGNSAFASSNIRGTLTVKNAGDIVSNAFSNIGGSFGAEINNKGRISSSAFKGSTGLTGMIVGSNVTDIDNNTFQGCSKLKTVNMGSQVSTIGSYAFDGCSSLQSIVLPQSVTTLGERAFQGCSKMTTAFICDNIKMIQPYTFSGCQALTNLTIGKGVKSIGTYAFSGCSSLPTVNIPKSVNSIGNYALQGCTSLNDVIMEEERSELSLGCNGSKPVFADCPLDSVFIGRNISYPTSSNYGYSPFYRNTSLRSIHITNVETEVSDNEFYGCTNLKNVRLGDGITKIGNWAFSGCSSLDYFLIGARTRTIGKEAFSDCTAMTRFISRAATPPTCGNQALDDINKWTCTLTVPKGKTAAYSDAAQWKEFFYMNESDAVDVVDEEVNVTLSARGYATYYNSMDSYSLPSELVAKVVTGVEGNRIIYQTIANGAQSNNVVPAGVAVMLESKSNHGGTYTLTLSVSDNVYTGTNLLKGSDVDTNVQSMEDEYIYKLSYGPSNSDYSNVFGWYWGAANGGAFDITAHKAWLTLKRSNAVKAYFIDDEITGIEEFGNETPKNQTIYDLQGRKVYQPNRKGIYIVNGKKIVRK